VFSGDTLDRKPVGIGSETERQKREIERHDFVRSRAIFFHTAAAKRCTSPALSVSGFSAKSAANTSRPSRQSGSSADQAPLNGSRGLFLSYGVRGCRAASSAKSLMVSISPNSRIEIVEQYLIIRDSSLRIRRSQFSGLHPRNPRNPQPPKKRSPPFRQSWPRRRATLTGWSDGLAADFAEKPETAGAGDARRLVAAE
jgi:hypothetical protein